MGSPAERNRQAVSCSSPVWLSRSCSMMASWPAVRVASSWFSLSSYTYTVPTSTETRVSRREPSSESPTSTRNWVPRTAITPSGVTIS